MSKRGKTGLHMKGRKLPHISESNKRRFKGKTYQEIYGNKSDIESFKRREGNRKRWDKIGRKTDLRPLQGDTWEYTNWRTKVFKRDNWTCQTCRHRGYIEAHHIKQWSKFPNDRFNIENGVTLCKDCHKLVHRRKDG